MIFVTVGEQLPFDRLIRLVDDWAASSNQSVFAQIGKSSIRPKNIEYKSFIDPIEFKEKFSAADFIVAHAGMGTIITALETRKPIVVMPRKAALGEHRNDHQFSTARRFLELQYISVAFDGDELITKLQNINELTRAGKIGKDSGPAPELIQSIRNFILK